MSDVLEKQLRTAFTARLDRVSPARAARLRAFDYHPRQHRFPGRPTLAATASALAAALIALILLLSSGTPAAFAGWTDTPSPPTAAALTAARAACGRVPLAEVVAAEARGPFTAIVYLRGASPWQCVIRGRQVLLHQSTTYPPSVVVKPASGAVSIPIVSHTVVGAVPKRSLNKLYKREDVLYSSSSDVQDEKLASGATARALRAAELAIILGPDSLAAVSGSVGADVSGVTFVLRDGTQVRATVGHGWYLAWWPGTDRSDETTPTAIRVMTVDGTTTAPYKAAYLSEIYRPCLAFQDCFGGAWNIDVIRGVSPSFTEHFGLFRNTAPIPLKQATSGDQTFGLLGAFDTAAHFGLDESQIHKVSLGSLGTAIWVVPGNEGVCVKLGSATDMNAPGSGGAGCSDLSEVLSKGLIVGGSQTFGLVADGNPTVTVCMTSGRRVTVPVKDNVFYWTFPGRPGTIYFKNAFGKPAHQLEWVSKQCKATR
jgi:hypothetical protein